MKKLIDILVQLKEQNLFHEIILNHSYFITLPDKMQTRKIQHLSYNSEDSELNNHSLFFIKGERFNKKYLEQAVDKGVEFYISELDYELPNTVAIIVSDVEKAMAIAARYFYDAPDEKIKTIGVTGTKGKTTTTYFLQNILSHKGNPAGLINSIEIFTGKEKYEASLTTPESLDTYRYLNEMVKNDLKYCVLEVSSQAYKKARVHLLHFDVCLFLNFSSDHVGTGEHDSMNEYFFCKRQLLLNSTNVVLNKQLPHFEFIKKEIKEMNPSYQNIYTFSKVLEDPHTDFYIDSTSINDFTLIDAHSHEKTAVELNMYGHYNHENATGSLIIGQLFNEDRKQMVQKIKKVHVDGRFEVYKKNNRIVVVDYAHNETSFRNIIQSARSYYGEERPFSVVTGSTGGKSESRRQGIARIFKEEEPHKVYLAMDDANFTNVEEINNEIIMETNKLGTEIYFDTTYQADREKQVEKALNDMADNEILFVLGKGTDKTQRMFGKLEPYIGDDVIVENWLKQEKFED